MKPEKFTPIAPTEEQKAYEELTKKEASDLNKGNSVFKNFKDSITGKGFNNEDIIRIDANLEKELREGAKGSIEGTIGWEAVEKLEKNKNSTLKYEGVPHMRIISGRINGHDVILRDREKDPYPYSGTIDGIELSEKEVWGLIEKYGDTAYERSKKIFSEKNKEEIEKQNIAEKEREKAEAIAEEEARVEAKMDAEIKAKADEEARIKKTIALKDLGL